MRIAHKQPSSNQPNFNGFTNVIQGTAGNSCAVITAQLNNQFKKDLYIFNSLAYSADAIQSDVLTITYANTNKSEYLFLNNKVIACNGKNELGLKLPWENPPYYVIDAIGNLTRRLSMTQPSNIQHNNNIKKVMGFAWYHLNAYETHFSNLAKSILAHAYQHQNKMDNTAAKFLNNRLKTFL